MPEEYQEDPNDHRDLVGFGCIEVTFLVKCVFYSDGYEFGV